MKISWFTLWMIVGIALMVPQVDAKYDYRFDKRSDPMGNFESEMSGKLERGVTNTLFGWTEIFKTPIRWADNPEHGKFKAFTLGLPYGVIRAAGRTGVGVYEAVTCYAPQKPIFSPIQGEVAP